jgi:hypothetical protein
MGRRLNKRQGGRGQGRPSDITNEFRDMVATRAMELRGQSYTLRETTEIVNEEYDDSLSITTVRKWIEDRVKPELEESANSYRQHLLDQIATLKRRLEPKMLMGDEKAISAWTRLLDREMRLTGVEKPVQLHVVTSSADSDALDVQRQLDQFFGTGSAAGGHVIQGEVVKREEGPRP